MSDAMPSVSGDFGEKPAITFPAVPPPTALTAQVLADGEGPRIEAGDTITVHYLGQTWDGHVFDNSYDRGAPVAFPIGIGAVIAGWDAGLVGRSIGSRVLLSIPPKDGYGARGVPQAGIRGNDTLVFVVDIVGVE